MKITLLFMVLSVSVPTVAQPRRPPFKSSIPGIGQLNLEKSFGDQVFAALLDQTLNKNRDLRKQLSSAFGKHAEPNYETLSFDIDNFNKLRAQLPSNNDIDGIVLLTFCNAFKNAGKGSACIVMTFVINNKETEEIPKDKCPCPGGNLLGAP